jgi:hypothetical protein
MSADSRTYERLAEKRFEVRLPADVQKLFSTSKRPQYF